MRMHSVCVRECEQHVVLVSRLMVGASLKPEATTGGKLDCTDARKHTCLSSWNAAAQLAEQERAETRTKRRQEEVD